MAAQHTLQKLEGWTPREGPVVFIILDGMGVDKEGPGNAVTLANPVYYDSLVAEAKKKKLHTLVLAHGPAVGLPTKEDMGNSEVGHNALGCGQIYSQGAKLVNESLQSGVFFKTPSWNDVVVAAAQQNKAVHFFGLLSDGNVHSHINQLFHMLDGVAAVGGKRIRIHPLLDGRDVAPSSGLVYVAKLEEKLKELQGRGVDARIGSGGGRMYVTMDRYNSDWNIVKRGWDAMVRGVIAPSEITAEYPGYFHSCTEAVECARKVFPKKLDQFNPPFVIVDENNKPIGKMEDGDAVINFNYRGDRAVQISKAFVLDNFNFFDRVERPKVKYAGLLEYDTEYHIPPVSLVPPPAIQHIASQYLVESGVTCYALAETHKYGHMTFFWNGNRSGYVNNALELYEEVPSLPNEETEKQPRMKAAEVTEKFLEALATKKYRFMRMNYANPDMVGHTGNIPAVVEAVKCMDEQLKKVIPAVMAAKGVVILTADHGNAEQMIDKTGAIMTSHSCNPVNMIVIDEQYKGEYVVEPATAQPGLPNLTATFMNLLGFQAPPMYQPSVLKFTKQ